MRSFTWDEVRARRLARSHLIDPAPASRLVEVVRDVGGIHAQVTAAADLSLGARVASLTRDDVRAELWERRTLVKTWTLRGTLHLHPADELPLWLGARRAVTGWRDDTWHEYEGLERERAEAVLAAIGDALDGRRLLRQELAEAVVGRVGEWAREPLTSGWAHLIGPAVATGVLCQGPPQGTRITFVRADQWVEGWHDVELDAALAEVCRRYVGAFGPVRPEAFAQWFGSRSFRVAAARRLFGSLGDELVEVDVEGKAAWLLARDLQEPQSAAPGPLRLIPEYDSYLMGFRERDRLLPDEVGPRLLEHGRGRYEGPAGVPWLIVDGAVRGLWSRRRRGKRIEVEVTAFARLTRAERAELESEVARIGRLVGAEAELTLR